VGKPWLQSCTPNSWGSDARREEGNHVDVIPLDFPDTTNPNRETKTFRSAVNAVAKRYRLRRDWMNDVVAAFTPPLGSLTLWRTYTHLQIYVPQLDCMLALKLLSAHEMRNEVLEGSEQA